MSSLVLPALLVLACLSAPPPHPASIPIPVPRSSLPLGPERANPTAVQMRLRGVPTRPRSSRPTRQVGLPSRAEERGATPSLIHPLPLSLLLSSSSSRWPRVQSDVQRQMPYLP
ncbi:hypothetical protein EV363DRAFT_630951 [Boletus edulis]|nr:hypothetical protein EV363DRAFT_630951 [Boletus edulis]